jgi:hypothetical protein
MREFSWSDLIATILALILSCLLTAQLLYIIHHRLGHFRGAVEFLSAFPPIFVVILARQIWFRHFVVLILLLLFCRLSYEIWTIVFEIKVDYRINIDGVEGTLFIGSILLLITSAVLPAQTPN